MSEIVYAVHTRACTYLLDEEGFCRWVLSRSGAKSDDRCVGAQFVAALDLRSKGGLIGELRIGASALFIRSEDGRFALIRTKPIEHVEIRGADSASADEQEDQADEYPTETDDEPEAEPVVLPDHLAVAAVFDAPVPAPEPLPPSARVIVQSHQARSEPPPVHDAAQAPVHVAQALLPPVPRPGSTMGAPLGQAELRPHAPGFPVAPPRTPFPAPRPSPRDRPSQRDPSQETQPLPPSGPMPAWPPMLGAPPPPAEMLPLGPARPHLPSAEELDSEDLEEVSENDQVYSMEVTLTMPLYRGDSRRGQAWRR